jgi:hypothetical protein
MLGVGCAATVSHEVNRVSSGYGLPAQVGNQLYLSNRAILDSLEHMYALTNVGCHWHL